MLKLWVLSTFCLWTVGPVWAVTDPSYANYNDVKARLRHITETYPKTTKLISLGTSDSGEVIEGLQIGDGPTKNLVVSTHHGNEYGSTEVSQAFAEAIAERPILGQTIYVIPVLNISGYNSKNRGEISHGNSYDPNRDYPGPCGSEGPHKLKSTATLARFIDREQIVASATLHTFYPAVVYPWGFSTHDLSTTYDELFKNLVQVATADSHYPVGNSSEVIYPANGTFEDYAFWRHGIWSLLFELGYSHYPSQHDIEETVRVNVGGLRKMFETAPTTRAENHSFQGTCDWRLLRLDRHDE